MTDLGGFWVSPDGDIYKIKTDHYQALKENPTHFGLKPSQVKNKKFAGLLPLADGLIRKGWIRGRDRGLHGWIFQVANVEDQLGAVADVLATAEAGLQERVNIASVKMDSPFYVGDVEDVYTGEILRNPQR